MSWQISKTKRKIQSDHSDPWVCHPTRAVDGFTFNIDEEQPHLTAQRQTQGQRRGRRSWGGKCSSPGAVQHMLSAAICSYTYTEPLSAQKQEQEFACLNKSASRGQILSRSQLTRLAGAQWAYVSPINQGQDLMCRIRSWDRSCEVKDQEQQMHRKTLGLSLASEHEEPEPG